MNICLAYLGSSNRIKLVGHTNVIRKNNLTRFILDLVQFLRRPI